MKRFILCLAVFAFIATFASAQSHRIGSLAEVEKANADFFAASIVGMTDNKQRNTPLYAQFATMLKGNVMAIYNKKGNVLVILGFPRKATDNPALLQTYYNMFGYGFTQGLEKAKGDTKLIIIAAQQPDGSYYDYFFPKSSIDALLAGSLQVTDFEQQAYVATGSAMDD